ncbi:hypothetical protein [Burkholderia sp. LMG 21824]|uniref:hypothetical protein n=1 Tax=Burkholderia sp. LMG 21824 TaxID=3158172 RepID=UPI003C2F9BAB
MLMFGLRAVNAGIGEHAAALRERICALFGWLGIDIDACANADHAQVVSSASSAVTVVVEPTHEAWIGVLRGNRDA